MCSCWREPHPGSAENSRSRETSASRKPGPREAAERGAAPGRGRSFRANLRDCRPSVFPGPARWRVPTPLAPHGSGHARTGYVGPAGGVAQRPSALGDPCPSAKNPQQAGSLRSAEKSWAGGRAIHACETRRLDDGPRPRISAFRGRPVDIEGRLGRGHHGRLSPRLVQRLPEDVLQARQKLALPSRGGVGVTSRRGWPASRRPSRTGF